MLSTLSAKAAKSARSCAVGATYRLLFSAKISPFNRSTSVTRLPDSVGNTLTGNVPPSMSKLTSCNNRTGSLKVAPDPFVKTFAASRSVRPSAFVLKVASGFRPPIVPLNVVRPLPDVSTVIVAFEPTAESSDPVKATLAPVKVVVAARSQPKRFDEPNDPP